LHRGDTLILTRGEVLGRPPQTDTEGRVLEAICALDDILARMQAHQHKKRAMLRRLHWWSNTTGSGSASRNP
jgi:hypothetical protein